MNKNVEWFVLEDWLGNELGRFKTLDEVDEKKELIVKNDDRFNEVVTDEDREEIENGILEDLYVYGLDKENNVVPVQFG